VFINNDFLGTGAVQLAIADAGTGALRLVGAVLPDPEADRAWALWLPDGRKRADPPARLLNVEAFRVRATHKSCSGVLLPLSGSLGRGGSHRDPVGGDGSR
jgi:hypothetical protein